MMISITSSNKDEMEEELVKLVLEQNVIKVGEEDTARCSCMLYRIRYRAQK
jgi:hypothetical protein